MPRLVNGLRQVVAQGCDGRRQQHWQRRRLDPLGGSKAPMVLDDSHAQKGATSSIKILLGFHLVVPGELLPSGHDIRNCVGQPVADVSLEFRPGEAIPQQAVCFNLADIRGRVGWELVPPNVGVRARQKAFAEARD